MRILPIIGLFLLPLLAAAGIYKWEGPDGRVQYSDRPVTGADYVGIQVDHGDEAADSRVPEQEPATDLGPYDSFEIVNPEPNQTLRNTLGRVDLGLLVEPPLAEDHRLRIFLDGQLVGGDAQGTQIRLQGLTFGSHRVQARIQDEFDETIASSPIVDFHLRKPLPEDQRP